MPRVQPPPAKIKSLLNMLISKSINHTTKQQFKSSKTWWPVHYVVALNQ